jgi:hypothetical protein
LASLNDDIPCPEDQQEIFEIKRQTVTTLVRRVTIDRNRELHVEIGLNLLKVLNYDSSNRFEGTNQDQIKTIGVHPHKLDLIAPVDLLNLDDDTPSRFEGKNKGQVKTAGIYSGWRDHS